MKEKREGFAMRTEGWAYPVGLSKRHYFDQSNKSLCGKWTLGSFSRVPVFKVKQTADNPLNCMVCRRKLALRNKRGGRR